MIVRTRFAPSPTGYMHIGGMRTALFNWLWARHNGGRFILRIDDTDRERNVDEALAPILHAFRWLGLDWDEGPEIGGPHAPYFQSKRNDFYRAALNQLLRDGLAYRDFDPPEVTQADREAAEREKRPFLNIRRSLDLSDSLRQQYLDEGRPYVVRFLVDRSAKVSIEDHIRGHVEWDCGLIADPVICRGDGSPLYNFATVVDDAHFEITHVVRAEEHLTNTSVQAQLFDALGYPRPEFAHIPFVAAPGTKEKLSKREKKLEKYRQSPQFKKLFDIADSILPQLGLKSSESLNPVMVEFYEVVGFLPDAVLNALARLGWSLDDKTEHMSLAFLTDHFTLDRVVKGPAGLDPDKLLAFQEHWMSRLTTSEKADRCLPFLTKARLVREPIDAATVRLVMHLVEAVGERLKLFSDILRYEEYFVEDDALQYDESAFDKRLRKPAEAADLLREFRDQLAAATPFDAATLEETMHDWVALRGIEIGQIIHALRVATTGKAVGPGMFDCLTLLGRDRCLSRIDRALERL
ncbi:MAG: glutamate--tRNA ligase [Planctomycetaceae bacterium]|nr:glutamate--tRNA ligase [Planctomycetaceae bacterium]